VASQRLCSIEGCDKKHKALGLCEHHYLKSRRVRASASDRHQRAARGAVQDFIKEMLDYSGDDCLIWPFGVSYQGYAVCSYLGKRRSASEIFCEARNGAKPAGHEPCHSCGNGHAGCVNPKHLSWKTHAENMRDMVDHGRSIRGTSHPVSKLSEADVRLIRENKDGFSQRKMSKIFKVSKSNIASIAQRKSWAWLS